MTLVMVGANPRRAPFLPLSASLAGEGALGAVLTALAGHRSVAEALVLATGEPVSYTHLTLPTILLV